jgi:hypothetical protein
MATGRQRLEKKPMVDVAYLQDLWAVDRAAFLWLFPMEGVPGLFYQHSIVRFNSTRLSGLQ